MLDAREAQARLNQKMAEAGEAAMPIKEKALELATTLLDKVTPALEGVSGWYQQLSPEQQDLVTNIGLGTLAFGGLATGAGKVLQMGTEVGGAIKGVSETFGGLKGAIGAVGGGWTSFTGLIAANPILLGVAAVAAAVAGLTWFFTQTETGKQLWSDFTGWISSKWQGVQDFFAGVPAFWQGVWDGVTGKAEEVKNSLADKFNGIKDSAASAWDNLKTNASDAWGSLQADAAEKFGQIANTVNTDMQTAQNVGSASSNALKAAMNGDWDAARAEADNAFNLIKDNISNKMSNARDNAISAGDRIGAKLGFPGLGSTVASKFGEIRNNITSPINDAYNTISGIPGRIQSAFNGIRVSLPHINLPHFSASWRDIGMGVRLPSISVDWYANGGYFDSPNIIGVGEAGGEHVTPDKKLRASVEDAVSRAFDRWGGAGSRAVEIAVTVNASVSDKLDAYTTGQQIGAGIASRLKQKGVTVGA